MLNKNLCPLFSDSFQTRRTKCQRKSHQVSISWYFAPSNVRPQEKNHSVSTSLYAYWRFQKHQTLDRDKVGPVNYTHKSASESSLKLLGKLPCPASFHFWFSLLQVEEVIELSQHSSTCCSKLTYLLSTDWGVSSWRKLYEIYACITAEWMLCAGSFN